MNKRELLRTLERGPEAWNQWRQDKPDVPIDLSEVHLEGRILAGANLSRVDFSRAHLNNADLSGADLWQADFTNALLQNVILNGAILEDAIFLQTSLQGADFRNVEFQRVDLQNAFLAGTNFRGTDLHNKYLPDVDLRGADLSQANLSKATLRGANLQSVDLRDSNLQGTRLLEADLRKANLVGAELQMANFNRANLYRANLAGCRMNNASFMEANLREADLQGADLQGADLRAANLQLADLSDADLRKADLRRAICVETNLERAKLNGCSVFGISAWRVRLADTAQNDLIITRQDEPVITVDDLEVAQFIYVMLDNEKIKRVVDTITSKSVLILGRFTEERKKVLDRLRQELRDRHYLPIVFDFVKPSSRDLTETVTLLARMSRFIIADLSDPKSLPQELTSIIPDLPSVPVQPIILADQPEYAMYEHWRRYRSVLEIHRYESLETLILDLNDKVITPPEKWIQVQHGN